MSDSPRDRLVVACVSADIGAGARLVRAPPEDEDVCPNGGRHEGTEGDLDGVRQVGGRHEALQDAGSGQENGTARRDRHRATSRLSDSLEARHRTGNEQRPEDPQARRNRDEDGSQLGKSVRQDETEEVPDSAVAEDDGR